MYHKQAHGVVLTAAVVGFKKVLPNIECDSLSGNQDEMEVARVEIPQPARQTTLSPSSIGKCVSKRFIDSTTAGRVSFRGTDLVCFDAQDNIV